MISANAAPCAPCHGTNTARQTAFTARAATDAGHRELRSPEASAIVVITGTTPQSAHAVASSGRISITSGRTSASAGSMPMSTYTVHGAHSATPATVPPSTTA